MADGIDEGAGAAVAPTIAEIAAHGWELTIHCARCRMSRSFVPSALAGLGDLYTPIDALRFRCGRCGFRGQPRVDGRGNAMMGHPRIWPPAAP